MNNFLKVYSIFKYQRTIPKKSSEFHLVIINTQNLLNPVVSFSGVTILLSLTVFMSMVSEIMPNTSDAVPLIGNPKVNEQNSTLYHIFYYKYL